MSLYPFPFAEAIYSSLIYIYRKKDKKDKRKVLLFLTEKGVEKRRIAKKVVTGFNDLIHANIPQSKLSMFYEVMCDINQTIEQYKEQNEI